MPRFNFTFQEPSPLISHTLRWTAGSRKNDTHFAGYDESSRRANRNTTVTSFAFKGTGVSVYGGLFPTHGNYSVALDGNYQSNASATGSNVSNSTLWESYSLGYGTHVVEIADQLSDLNYVSYLDIKSVQIERNIGQKNDTIYNATLDCSSPFVHYTHGVWKPFMSSYPRKEKDTIHTVSPNSQFTINFQGCCIELYGLYADAAYNVSLDGQSPVQMQGKNSSLEKHSRMWDQNTLLYMVDGLADDLNHTVTVSTLSGTNNNRPFFFDHAVVRSTQGFVSGTPFLTSRNETALEYPSQPRSPVHHRLPLIIGATVGGIVLLSLVGVAIFLLHRWWKNQDRNPLRVDLLEEVDLPKFTSAPVPWLLLRRARPPSSSWQLSSVISGWRRLSLDQTESGIAPSTLSPSGESSITPSNRSSPCAARQPRQQNVQLNIANR